MVKKGSPNYTELVHEVLMAAPEPLTFAQLFEEVNRRQPVATRDPKGTIRNVLNQSMQLASLRDGRYGYLPHLLRGGLFRHVFSEAKPAQHPLVFSSEVRQALWPTFLDARKRQNFRPARLRLPTGEEVDLELEFLRAVGWGSAMPELLSRYLAKNRAAAGDSLLIRVLDAESGSYEARFEPKRERDGATVAERSRELADDACEALRKHRSDDVFVWELAIDLIARGLYQHAVAPDSLGAILKGDPRFVDSGMDFVTLAEHLTPEKKALIARRRMFLPGLLGGVDLDDEDDDLDLDDEDDLDLDDEDLDDEDDLDFDDDDDDIDLLIASVLGGLSYSPREQQAIEKALADVSSIMSERGFASAEDARDHMEGLLADGGLPRLHPATPLDKAQELMYDAWQVRGDEGVKLAWRALGISRDCADAYVLLAEETAQTPEEELDFYAKGMAAGERALGEKAFKDAVGAFWGILETRPYMRARFGFAATLWEMGRRQEAVQHYWEMLRLNPGDNQGIRYVLLPALLETGDQRQAKKLLGRYPDDVSAIWKYGRALHAFRKGGDSREARRALAEAKEANRLVPAYLLKKKRLPRQLPDTVGIGDRSEAVWCAAELLEPWRATPGAVSWLEQSDKAR